MSVLEAVFHGWIHVELVCNWKSLHISSPQTDISNDMIAYEIISPKCGWTIYKVWPYTVFYATRRVGITEVSEIALYSPDVSFILLWDEWYTSEEWLTLAAGISSKYVVPLYTKKWWPSQSDLLEFARRLLLDNYAVPKLLRSWQAVVVTK